MIADNIIYFAVFIFVMMIIGLVLTVLEFRHGQPKRQQLEAERNPQSVADLHTGTAGRPAR